MQPLSLAEFKVHCTALLRGADTLAGTIGQAEYEYEFGSLPGQWHALNLTAGLHGELTPMTSFRVAAVVPVTSSPNREFDSEIAVQVVRRF